MIRFLRSESHTFSNAERRLVTRIAESTFAEVRRILPGTPERIEITVRPGTDVIPEIGQGGDAMPPNGIMWRVDPSRPGGVAAIANTWLRACLFHELHHLARDPAAWPQSIVEHATERWIGYKVGTYWVDQARAGTQRSSADLVGVPTTEILEMARATR